MTPPTTEAESCASRRTARSAAEGNDRRLVWWLVAVALVYLAVQLTVLDTSRKLEWDEAVYLSEVTEGVQSGQLDAHRARGITLLVMLPAALGVPLSGIRIYLAVLSAGCLLVAFRPWIKHVGPAAVLAAGLFAASWLAIFYGSEISPNLFVAFAAVAAAGYLVSSEANAWATRPLLVVAFAMFCVALFRPTDSLWLGAGFVAAILVVRSGYMRPIVALGAGSAMGWLQWVVEAHLRFEGPLQRLRHAARLVKTVPASGAENALLPMTMQHHLSLTDGTLMGPELPIVIPLGGVIWWLAMSLLTVRALYACRQGRFFPVLAAASAGFLVAAPYLFLIGSLAPRFLLPAYGLLSIPTAAGLLSFARGGRIPVVVGRTAVAAVTIVWLVWGLQIARAEALRAQSIREAFYRLGVAVARAAPDDEPCRVVTEAAYPQIAFVSRCRVSGFDVTTTMPPRLYTGEPANIAIAETELPENSPLHSWRKQSLEKAFPRWTLYSAP